MTANPSKAPGTRISLNSVHPGSVFPIWDEDQPDTMIGCDIVIAYDGPADDSLGDANAVRHPRIRKLSYRIQENNKISKERRISREEAVYEVQPSFWATSEKLKKIRTIIPFGLLDSRIDQLPIYWFPNKVWDGEDYGSSELRGIETMGEIISQGSTDVTGSLSLEGLGVFATDGGRPVDEHGVETEWEVSPGKVMEVPQGSYFRRVEGVTSITPATDQIKYLESKMNESVGLNDVALGKVDAQIAASGIALAIRFSPTLAKIETRDQQGIDKLTQLFYNLKTWYEVFEQETLAGDIIPVIGDKLPTDRVAKVNELNNMMDRKVISAVFYRAEMKKLGYEFPADATIEKQIEEDIERVAVKPAEAPADEDDNPDDADTLDKGNQSNNKNRPNESSGTEAQNKKPRDSATK